MASDNLNQVGKYIKKTSDTADYAVKKQRPNRPSVARTRDIFDATIPFTMYFDVAPKQTKLMLDMEFNKPPPMSECIGTPCRMACEEFELTAGDHEILMQDPYTTGLTLVYVNGAAYSTTKWAEVSPDSGSLLVTQLPLATNTVTVCYMRECDTTFDCSEVAAHGGVPGQDIYYDVFGAHLTSGGGCEWYVPPFLDTGVAINFCYTPGPSNGLQEAYGEGDQDVNLAGSIQPNGTPNGGGLWGMPATVWFGGHSEGHWVFNFPATRVCGAFISGFGGMGGTATTVDYQAGEWDIVDGSFGSGAVVPLVPVVTDTITLHWEYNAPPGLQFYGGIRYSVFMVWGEQV